MGHEGKSRPDAFKWQKKDGINIIQDMDCKQFNEELLIALSRKNSRQSRPFAIWINESMFHMEDYFMPPIREFSRKNNIAIDLVCSARDYHEYLFSAYQQWGVKHKTYKGPIKSFDEWCIEEQGFLKISNHLKRWNDYFDGNLKTINFAQAGNILLKILELLPPGIRKDLECFAQESPITNSKSSMVEHLIFSIINNRSFDEVLPSFAGNFLNQYPCLADDSRFSPIRLSTLFPNSSFSGTVLKKFEADIVEINKLLRESGEPAMNSENMSSIDFSEIECIGMVINAIFAILHQQSDEISSLKNLVREQRLHE